MFQGSFFNMYFEVFQENTYAGLKHKPGSLPQEKVPNNSVIQVQGQPCLI